MCGRFSQAYTWEQIIAFSQPLVAEATNLQPHFNIRPTDTIQVMIRGGQGRELVSMRWGLIPPWWKGKGDKRPTPFNAREETVDTLPSFKNSFRERRCIIPASGFFEWTGPKENRIPHFFSASDGELLAFAGLWGEWTDKETGERIRSCTIIVREGDDWMKTYHDRMPSMLASADFDRWLDGTGGRELLRRPPPALQEWIVRKNLLDDDPETIEPAFRKEAENPELDL